MTAKKKDVFERPAPKGFDQPLPRGVSSLLGGEEEHTEATPAPTKKRKGAREKFSLSYRAGYRSKLMQLYLREKMKNEKLQKSDLVEEALDLLFEKYGVQEEKK
ncbi:MAG: hypothetical protein QNJ97_25115 [Myxococcota bacterium]|nr:hypothetical protein [Myxococcota bacterium]